MKRGIAQMPPAGAIGFKRLEFRQQRVRRRIAAAEQQGAEREKRLRRLRRARPGLPCFGDGLDEIDTVSVCGRRRHLRIQQNPCALARIHEAARS
jgi:hypothetical protein